MRRLEEKQQIGIRVFLNKEISLFIKDYRQENDKEIVKINRRDGVLIDFDDLNYYIKPFYGLNKGSVIAILKTTVTRIEPILNNSKGDRYE